MRTVHDDVTLAVRGCVPETEHGPRGGLENFASDDWDFPWTMLEHGAVSCAIPRALYVVRDHRDGFRLTTHGPRSVQQEGLLVIRNAVREAGRGYLQQSFFRNRLHRWIREQMGFNAQQGWCEL